MITDEEIKNIREKIKETTRPLIFFDDDADGVTSFVMLYKMLGDGKGICVKGKPTLEAKYTRNVEEYTPDRIFVLDKPMIEQEFLDEITQEVIWIDHHPLQDNKRVKYYNPRKNNPEDNRPTSYWVYRICEEEHPEYLWIAGIGVVGDWSLALKEELHKKYPELMPKEIKHPAQALFTTKIGKLAKILEFNLKGTTAQVMQSIKVLTRIKTPEEILEQTTPQGKYLYKKYLAVNEKYEEIKNTITITEDPLILFKYTDTKLAISSMLSNELLFENPNKIIIIAREKADEMMLSIRSSEKNILEVLTKSLEGIQGYGGGHNNACGACIKKQDFDRFIENFKENLK